MVEPVRIFLGDLTYNTIGMSTEVFPLNIGYIASYCKKQFGSNVDITLFKYIDELEEAIIENPPDVLGLSNYVCSYRIGLEMFNLVRRNNSNAITVWGGPNFPQDLESQKSFMEKCSVVDFYVPIEGEIGFSNIFHEFSIIFQLRFRYHFSRIFQHFSRLFHYFSQNFQHHIS